MRVKRQVLFVQGGGAKVHDEWDDKLVESLGRELGQEYEIRYPRMPNEDDPGYAAWKAAIEREFCEPDLREVGAAIRFLKPVPRDKPRLAPSRQSSNYWHGFTIFVLLTQLELVASHTHSGGSYVDV